MSLCGTRAQYRSIPVCYSSFYVVSLIHYSYDVIFNNDACLSLTGCGGEIRQRSGTITSPGYPGPYPANAFCFWEIFIPDGDLLTLEFDDFNIEHADAETKYCMSDKVVIIHHTYGEGDAKPR